MNANNLNNQSNEDLLKVENLEKNEYLVTSSIVDVPIEKIDKKPVKVTVFGALIAALSINKGDDDLYALIRPVKTLKFCILLVVLTTMIYFFYQVADVKLILPIIIIFASIAIPILMVTISYELCPQKNITFFQIFVSFSFGLLIYLSIDSLVNKVLIKMIYATTIDTVIVPVLWGIAEVIFVAILAKMYNLTTFSSTILLAVSVGSGFATAWSLHAVVETLFIPVEVISNINSSHYSGLAIVDDITFTNQSIKAFFEIVPTRCFYFPVAIASWSVAIGSVATNSGISRIKRDKPFSLYLLLVLVIVLFILSMFTTSFEYFDVVLKIISLLTSLLVAIRLVNTALNREMQETINRLLEK
ncbi:MAG: hypothetical protein IKJ19_01700 [Clostridia bacterium]|nr:hypothetical protein [Clostridia bacterium]